MIRLAFTHDEVNALVDAIMILKARPALSRRYGLSDARVGPYLEHLIRKLRFAQESPRARKLMRDAIRALPAAPAAGTKE